MDEMTLEECINLVFGSPVTPTKIKVMERVLGTYIEESILGVKQ